MEGPTRPVGPITFLRGVRVTMVQSGGVFCHFLWVVVFVRGQHGGVVTRKNGRHFRRTTIFAKLVLFSRFGGVVHCRGFRVYTILVQGQPRNTIVPYNIRVVEFVGRVFGGLANGTRRPLLITMRFEGDRFFVRVVGTCVKGVVYGTRFLCCGPCGRCVHDYGFGLFRNKVGTLAVGFVVVCSASNFCCKTTTVTIVGEGKVHRGYMTIAITRGKGGSF